MRDAGENHTIRERPDIIAAIDTTLTGCMIVLSCFENALDKLHGDDTGRGRSLGSLISRWRKKARIMWNEDDMKGYISLLQGQQSALTFLVQVLHIESIDEILEKIRNGRGFLDKQAIKAESLRRSNPQVHVTESVLGLSRSADTISGDGTSVTEDQEFDFDNIVINSRSYRRAMAMAQEVVLNRRKVTTTSTSGSRQSNMSPENSTFDTSAELQSTELDSLETIPAVPRSMQNLPSPSGTPGTPQQAVPGISFETVQDDKTGDDKNKDTTAGHLYFSVTVSHSRQQQQHHLTSTNTFTQPQASDGTSLPPKTLNIRADELSRLLQLLRFSRVSHRERLDVTQKKEKEIVDKGSVAAAKIPGKYAFLDQQRASAPNVYQSLYNMPSGLSKYAKTPYGLIPSGI